MFTTAMLHSARRKEPIDLTQGLVAHYLLNNSAEDVTGNYDGTPSGGVDFQGDQVYFNSSDDGYIDVPDTISVKTLSMWVTFDDLIKYNTLISILVVGDVTYTHMIAWGTDSILRLYITTTNYFDVANINDLTEDTLYNIVITTDGTTYKSYIDGVLTATHSSTATMDIRGFGYNTKITRNHLGNMSNIRLYNEAKDQAFINALYLEGYYPKPLPLPTTDGLIAHYPLTGTAEDVTGNYDGTEIGGLIYADDAERGAFISFDGVNDYIDLPVMGGFNQWSVSLWCKPENRGNNYSALFVDDNQSGMAIKHSGTDEKFYVYDGSTSYFEDVGTSPFGAWYHIVVVCDGSTVKLYNNLANTVSVASSFIFPNTGYKIGRVLSEYSGHEQSNTRVYNRALTQQEITDIYNYEKNFRPIDIDNGLIAYYPLSSNSLDNYYNQYDGTDTAGVTYDGIEATIPNGDTITFPAAAGFVEAYYTINSIVTKTTSESVLNTLTDCTLKNVRKYSIALTQAQQHLIGYSI